jgi:hypothetical protein
MGFAAEQHLHQPCKKAAYLYSKSRPAPQPQLGFTATIPLSATLSVNPASTAAAESRPALLGLVRGATGLNSSTLSLNATLCDTSPRRPDQGRPAQSFTCKHPVACEYSMSACACRNRSMCTRPSSGLLLPCSTAASSDPMLMAGRPNRSAKPAHHTHSTRSTHSDDVYMTFATHVFNT